MMHSLRLSLVLAATSLATFAAAAEPDVAPRPRPASADAAIKPRRVPIVDVGADFLRDGDGRPNHQFHVHRWEARRSPDSKLYQLVPRLEKDLTTDVDGDGKSSDDVVVFHPFSLTRPFSPDAPWYDSLAGTPRWYGGAVILQANRRDSGFSEDGVNHEHDGPMYLPRDNWALFHETYEVFSPYRMAGVWIWKKEDFLNRGDQARVSLSEGGELALYLQRYFMGVDAVRFVIRQGREFYLSEAVFRGAGQAPGQSNGRQHILRPSATRWAAYQPKAPHDIWFDPEAADFQEKRFDDVTAVGFYASKDRWRPAYVGFKWYAFECDAVVHRIPAASESVAMRAVEPADAVAPFWISRSAVPYKLWKRVFRLARSNTFVRNRGFIFDRDGDMGAMDADPGRHGPEEPVTDLTLHDVAAWCNALSLQEGKTPCYYEDADGKTVFRYVKRSPMYGPPRPLPRLHVNWQADGYRLPTPSEWREAAIEADGYWHYVWTGQDPAAAGGGDKAMGRCGFYLVRRRAGLPAPGQGDGDPIDLWETPPDARSKPIRRPASPVETRHVPAARLEVAVTETSYEQWRTVRDWALAKGYAFDCDGDMGSMDYWGMDDGWGRARPHGPTEPVTDITFYDAAVWCNALSELEGRTCVYYEDPECTKVYRRAFVYRPLMKLFFETERLQDAGTLPKDRMKAVGRVYTKPGADGYRLPTTEEFRLARLAGGKTRYSWGREPAGVFGRAWLFDNSGGGTRPVATTRPNPAGLYDMEGNVSELCSGAHPKWDVISGVGQVYRCGGSFLELTVGVGKTTPPRTPAGWGYPDVGFRVVRKAPPRRSRRLARPRRVLFLNAGSPRKVAVRPERFDALQGRVHRGNLHRTGTFEARGLASVSGVKWAFRTGGPVRSSPVVTGGAAYVGSNDGYVYAIDVRTGERRWRYKTPRPVTGSAAVHDGAVYIASEDGYLYALEVETGKLRWRARMSGRFRPCNSPAVAYGAVFVATGATGGHDQGTMSAGPVLAFDADDGTLIWTGPRGPQGYAGICLDATRLYAGSNASNYQAVDIATGRGLWTKNAGHQNRQWTSMTRYGTFVYAPGAMTGTVQAWDPESGRELWQEPVWPQQRHALNNQGEPGHEVLADLAVAEGRVIAACNDGAVQSFDAQTGRRGWRREFDTSIQASPSIAGSTVYVAGWDGQVRALKLDGGQSLWRFKPSSLPAPDMTVGSDEPSARIISSPWIGDGVLYVGCDDGFVYAIEGPVP